MIELRPPAENPAGDGPADVNPLLDALRGGAVLKESGDTVDVFYRMVDRGRERIERVTFAGSTPGVRDSRPMDPLSFSLTVSRSMGAGLSDFSLTTPEDLEQRERDHRVALAFFRLAVMERKVARGVEIGPWSTADE